ncbi:cytochrome c oxidase subunit II [Pseudoxanthomonas mexicana]|uniref:cytochrome c oxidase subunit II n=1 Tax=Pseudoxanthomonas mexicana TaxID=128785 RepID=UPI00398A9B2A
MRLARVVALPGAALLASGCRGVQSALDPAGPAALAIARIWWVMLIGGTAIFLLVMACLLWAMNRRSSLRHPSRLVLLGGLAMPTAVLLALLVYGIAGGRQVVAWGQPVDRTVEVIGRQWEWEFRHPGADGRDARRSIDTLVMPAGELVEFRIASEDVIHSFWVPRLGGKIDAIPGRVNTLRLRADAPGAMRGQCAEFCGLSHTHMAFDVRVVPAPDYARWLRGDDAAAHIDATHGAPR